VAAPGALLVATFIASRHEATAPEPAASPRVAAEVTAPAPGAPANPERVQVNISVLPQEARLFLDERRLASNPFRDSLPRDAREHTFRAEAAGFEVFTKSLRLESDVDITVSMKADKAPAKAPAPPRARPRVAAAPHPAPAPAPEPVAIRETPPPAPPEPAPTPAPRAKAVPGEDLRGTISTERVRREVKFEDPYAKP